MPDDGQKLWSCAGSAGIVNLPDVGKIIFSQSVAQLGPGRPVVTESVAHKTVESALPGTETITAVIRYGVVPVDGVYQPADPTLQLCLRLRYRDGSGHVLARLIEVNIVSGTEQEILKFDSAATNTRSNSFQVQTSPGTSAALDFFDNAYYVELTLSVTERIPVPPPYPPALSVVQLFFGGGVIE